MKNQVDKPAPKVTAKDFAYSQMKQWIIEGKLRPGQSIIEADISSKLEISRTPLREALQRLELENMVVRQSNGRLKIAPISVQEVNEIFNVRSKLEGIVTGEATEHASETDIKNLSAIVSSSKKAYQERNIEDILYYGAKFHASIYELSGNKTVMNILSQLNDQIHRYRRLVPNQNTDQIIEEDEHQIILSYIADGDAEGAARAMQTHIENSLSAAVIAVEAYEKEKVSALW